MADETTSTAQATDAAAATGTDASSAAATQQTGQETTNTSTAAAAAEASTAATAAAEKAWYADLPSEAHDSLQGFASLDEMAAAAARGKDLVIPEDVAEYKLQFSGDTAGAEHLITEFATFCKENKIPPAVAQQLIIWQEDQAAKAGEAAMDTGKEVLAARWGAKQEVNTKMALSALAALDKRMDGRLSVALGGSGAANNPDVVEALYHISTMISEDSLGGGGAGGGGDKPMEAVDTYRALGFK